MSHERFKHLLRSVWAICWKDLKIYYAKGPVVVMGVLFPLFLWFSFYAGRGLEIKEGLASLLMITLFFTSSAITPIIAPWETRQKTIEMLLARPITISTILLGDILASTLFGLIFAFPPILYGIILGIIPNDFLSLMVIILLTAIGFSALGIIFSALPTDTPADAVLLASTIKLPLVFISGVLIPLNQIPKWIFPLALLSPLTYPTDFLRNLYTNNGFISSNIDITFTVLFTLMFIIFAIKLHKKTIIIRIQK